MSQYDPIPSALKKLRQWVCVGENKVPLQPIELTAANVNDPTTWNTFENAVNTGTRHIGFVLTKDDPYTIIDLDAPLDGRQEARHAQVIEQFDSYTEISQSGHGAHIIIKGSVPCGARRDKLEVYSDGRYMICTGVNLNDKPIEDRQELLNVLYSELHPKVDLGQNPLVEISNNVNDIEVIEKAKSGKSGVKFSYLFDGDWQQEYPSQSEADFALLNLIANETPSNQQVRDIFRQSALGQRKKAQRDKYLDYAISQIRSEEEPIIDAVEIPVPKVLASKDKYIYTFPPGLIGEIAAYSYSSAIRPVKEISLALAIACVSGIASRSFNISNMGLNQYLILLANTGTGKDELSDCVNRLFAEVSKQFPNVYEFIGPSNFASGQGLVRELDERPCFFSVLSEIGQTMQVLCSPKAPAYMVMLEKIITEIYSKSGVNGVLYPTAYSDAKNNTKTIKSPCVTILGESTQQNFYKHLKEEQITKGFLPRFSFIDYKGGRPKINKKPFGKPSKALIDQLEDLVDISCKSMVNNESHKVKTDKEAEKFLYDYNDFVDNKMNDPDAGDTVHNLWNRAHVKVLRLAALVAVGVNMHDPIVTIVEAKWSADFVTKDIKAMLSKFEKGSIGSGLERQESEIKAAIIAYAQFTKANKLSYQVPKLVADTQFIPQSYLRRRLKSSVAFESEYGIFSDKLTKVLDDMVNSDILVRLNKTEARNKYNVSTALYTLGESWK